jgi:methyl-accepting chemotaxis protein
MSIQVYQKCLLQLSGLSMQIATAAEEQSSVSNEINNHVIEIKQTSELNWQLRLKWINYSKTLRLLVI